MAGLKPKSPTVRGKWGISKSAVLNLSNQTGVAKKLKNEYAKTSMQKLPSQQYHPKTAFQITCCDFLVVLVHIVFLTENCKVLWLETSKKLKTQTVSQTISQKTVRKP